jgi:hypothetical protein
MSRHSRIEEENHSVAASPHLIAARDELGRMKSASLWQAKSDEFNFRVHCEGQSLWLIVEWPGGGRVACRPVYAPAGRLELVDSSSEDSKLRVSLKCAVGIFHAQIELASPKQPLVHWRTSLVPTENLTISDWPGDIYPCDSGSDPLGVGGSVHTAQKGPTGAILFATITRPWRGSFLYAQNLTALNEYFAKTKTTPIDRISSSWPELGFMLPTSRTHAIQAAQNTVISDAYLLLSPEVPDDKLQAARLFLDLYAELYLALPKPPSEFRDWARLVDETVRDLTHSSGCGVERDGQRYLLAYVGANDRPPESMVQLALLLPMIEYEKWLGEKISLAEKIRANLPSFYRDDAKTMVRWLPGDEHLLGGEEHMGEEIMDSWYLYHTYLNLSRLALDGDELARRLFLDSVDYGIAVARHFSYHWPVFYNIHTLDVIKSQTKPGMGGEHDVGAQYVHVMMQAWDLTGERRFIEEAERSAGALESLGFDLGYQFNNTSFGAGGLLRLWKATGREVYRDLSYACIANVVRNFWLWECDYGYATNYHTFLGLVPLRDAEYLAIYEELEAMAAFHDYLEVGGDDVPTSIRLLLCEYCKYVIDRAWYYYPGQLPREMIDQNPRSGHINRDLAIPLEDIYEGWQKAGKVGQEVYGAGAPFVFATRHCQRIEGVTFRIHCNYPIHGFTSRRSTGHRLSTSGRARFRIAGDGRCRCHVRIVPGDYTPLPRITLKSRRGRSLRTVEGQMVENGYLEFELPGNAQVQVAWRPVKKPRDAGGGERNGEARPRRNRKKRTKSASRG